jgi:hypothetical protein
MFAPNYSLGARWRLGNEDFMDFLTERGWLDMIDFTFSYGYTGNAVAAVSPWLIAQDGGLSPDFHQYILRIRSLPYPDLGWEETRDWNFGLDFSFFQGRLTTTFATFGRVSDVLSSRPVPVENGMESAIVDGTQLRNNGFNITVGVTPIRTRDINWTLTFNTGIARTTVEENTRQNTLDDYLFGMALVGGSNAGALYSFAFAGIDGETGWPMFHNLDIGPTPNPRDFLVRTGKTRPDISGGLNSLFRYRAFTVRAQFSMAFGATRRLPPLYANLRGAPLPDTNISRELLNRWRQPGDEAIPGILPGIPGITEADMLIDLPLAPLPTHENPNPTQGHRIDLYRMYNMSDARIARADFIRLRQLGISYTLPGSFTQSIGASHIQVGASMSNPFFIAFDSRWRGMDPETGGWPARRTTSLNLSVSF